MSALSLPSVLVTAVFLGSLVSAPASAGPRLLLDAGDFDPRVDVSPLPAELLLAPGPGSPPLQGVQPWIVQYEGPGGDERIDDLSAAGAVVHGYLPEHAYLVTMEASRIDRLATLPGVRWTGFFEPGYRISSAVGTQEFRTPTRRDAEDLTLVVRLFADPWAAAHRFRALGCRVLEAIENPSELRLVVEAAPALLPELARDPLTWWIEEKPETFLLNQTTRWVVQSNANGQTPIWDRGITGAGEIVTLMDSGVDYNSCFFRENGNLPPGPSHRKIIDYSTWGGNVYDGCGTGHGTHVAGTIAGEQSYITGSTDHAGMAFDARLTVQDVGADGFLDCLLGFVNVPATLTGAFGASYALGARVHSNSWGSTSNAYDTYAVNVDQFMWNNPNFLVVFANGNSGPGSGTVGSPATAKNLISVGATQQAPNQNTVAGYSSRGPTADGRIKPTVVAPGGDSNGYITSANNNSGNPPSPTCAVQGSPFAGTSMATPAIAGLAALTRQYFRDGFYPLGAAGGDPIEPSAALVKALLVNAATDAGAADIPNNNEGFGRLLLDDGLYFDGDARELRIEQDPGVSTGQTRTFTYEIEVGQPFEVALVWTDYPATQGAGVALVNDLDLRVTSPSGTDVYLGNRLSGGQSVTGGSADRRNVEEIFRLNAPTAGAWEIEVTGFNVPQGGAQPFALVATGAFANWPQPPVDVPEVGEAELAGGWSLLSPDPNPFTGTTSLALRVPEGGGSATVAIYDAGGRLVRSLAEGPFAPGLQVLEWDGRDGEGTTVAPGVYFVRARVGQEGMSRKLVLVR